MKKTFAALLLALAGVAHATDNVRVNVIVTTAAESHLNSQLTAPRTTSDVMQDQVTKLNNVLANCVGATASVHHYETTSLDPAGSVENQLDAVESSEYVASSHDYYAADVSASSCGIRALDEAGPYRMA